MTSLSALGRRWVQAPSVPEALGLARSLELHTQVASLLWNRGHQDAAQIRAFLDPRLQSLSDPFLLTDLRRAAERILQAIAARERIVIFGDYDVDGITSSALLWRVLRALGAEAETFLPLRMEEGYGLSQEGIERCVDQHQPALLIAVDCGTTALDQVAWLRSRGIDVIIADHHALPPQLPGALALINPQRDGRFEYLASVGLVFKLCHGLLKLTGEGNRKIDLRDYLDLVALGTVADIVPLIGENRILVRRGLAQMERSCLAGIRALVEVSQVSFPITAQDVGFRLGPRLNASGRLGDAMLSLRLLQTDDRHEAGSVASELNLSNRERQNVEMETFLQADAQLQESYDPARDWGIVLSGLNWHWGVIGIVASRLQKRYHRPTIVIGLNDDGLGKGSGRSIDGISIVRALHECSSYLELFGGHDMAAGLNIRADRIIPFREAFTRNVRAQGGDDIFQSTLLLSGTLSLHEVGDSLYRQLEELAPFGRSNPEPVFLIENLRCVRPAQPFGRNHVKLFLRGDQGEIEAVGFGLGNHDWSKPPSRLAGTLDWDDYRDRVQIRIVDWQP
ncbi:MAG TPA: single-stranded-DNA-specific exonuclease RecJ [Candidatus Methylacidiphilales bacterium]|nr:single-stranded-DNA-specific exonuclease RecJ [Candidatus Methylacidiphilales bacterium]